MLITLYEDQKLSPRYFKFLNLCIQRILKRQIFEKKNIRVKFVRDILGILD